MHPVKNATRARFRPMAGRNRGNRGPCFSSDGKSDATLASRPGSH